MRHEIGTNAGIIWHAVIANEGRTTFRELIKTTGLTESQALLSLGWLEREGKVSLHGDKGIIEAVLLYQKTSRYPYI